MIAGSLRVTVKPLSRILVRTSAKGGLPGQDAAPSANAWVQWGPAQLDHYPSIQAAKPLLPRLLLPGIELAEKTLLERLDREILGRSIAGTQCHDPP